MIVLKKSTTDTIKATSKRAIKKTTEANDDLTGHKIDDKISSVSKKSSAENSKKSHSEDELEVPKKRYISPEERQQIIDELRLV